MQDNERYAKYMVRRREWSWWDTWLDTFVWRALYMHNQDNALLAKYDIECPRNAIGAGHYGHGSYGPHSATLMMTAAPWPRLPRRRGPRRAPQRVVAYAQVGDKTR